MTEKNHLRREAGPINLKTLDEERKDALKKIVAKMKAAHENIPQKSQTQKPKYPTLYYYNKNQFNNVIFISGSRGTGKTSLLISLTHLFGYCAEGGHSMCFKENCNERGIENCSEMGHFCNNVRSLTHNLVWLKPLELESLPGPTNLLAAIFSRLDEAIRRLDKECVERLKQSSYITEESGYHGAIMEFQRLERDVAMAWEGNLPDRGAQLDPDAFAVESLRTEYARIDLNDRFSQVLNKLAQEIFHLPLMHNPMFILPIDDFDLNPKRYLEMIHLLDLIPSPRLFVIILGNYKICRRLLYLKVRRDFHLLLHNSGTANTGSSRNAYDGLAYRIASDTLRKNIPPGHVIELGRPYRDNKIEKPNTDKIDSEYNINVIRWEILESLRQNYHVKVKTAVDNKYHLTKFLRFQDEQPTQETGPLAYHYPKEKSYAGPLFLQLPYRHLIDLRMTLKQLNAQVEKEKHRITDQYDLEIKDEKSKYDVIINSIEKNTEMEENEKEKKMEKEKENLKKKVGDIGKKMEQEIDKKECYKSIRLAYRILMDSLDDEDLLSSEARNSCKKSIGRDFEGKRELDTSRFKTTSNLGSKFDIPVNGCSLSFHRVKDWSILLRTGKKPQKGGYSEASCELKNRSGAAIAFYHDLLALTSPSGITGDYLPQKAGDLNWAYAEWGDQPTPVTISWLIPPFRTFWACALFRAEWNKVWSKSKDFYIHNSKLSDNDKIIKMVITWICLGTAIIDDPISNKEIDLTDIFSDEDDDNQLLKECFENFEPIPNWLEKNKGALLPRKKLVRGWLANIACTLAPESGIPENRELIEKFESVLLKPDIARQIRKIRTKRAARFKQAGYNKFATDLFCPKRRVASHCPGPPIYYFNQIGNGALCPFIADIESFTLKST